MPSGTGAWKTILICGLGLAVNSWIAWQNRNWWGMDFNQFYCASKLAGTGQLYNYDALRALEAAHGTENPSGRIPALPFVEKPVGWMPFRVGQIVWLAASALALAAFALLWPRIDRGTMLAGLCWSTPAFLLLILGQDTPFWLAAFALGLRLLDRGHPRLAGVAFSFCISKYHLAIGIPFLLIAQKRWSTVLSGAAAGAVWIAASFAIEGPGWPWRYVALVTRPLFSPAPERMPNLRGVAHLLPWPAVGELVLAAVVCVLLVQICRRSTSLGAAGAVAAAAGLLVARHGYANDCALLIPLLALTIERPTAPGWLRLWALWLLSPVPFLLIGGRMPAAGQVALVAFVPVAMAWERLTMGSGCGGANFSLPGA